MIMWKPESQVKWCSSFLFRQGLSLDLELINLARLAASKVQELTSLYVSIAEIINTHRFTQLLHLC